MTEAAQIPAHVPKDRVYRFDFRNDPLFFGDPHVGLDRLAQTAPGIFYTPENGGHWVVIDYDACIEISRAHEEFSNANTDIPRIASPQRLLPTNVDPPESLPYRALLTRHLGPRKIAALEGRIRTYTRDLICAFVAEGRCDFVFDLAAPLPAMIFMEQAGMPVARLREFQALVRRYLESPTIEERGRVNQEILAVVARLIRDKRGVPGTDIITDIVTTEINGRRLSDGEATSMVFLIFLAGLDTVVSALTFSMKHLAGDPALQTRLHARPADIAPFIEEALRRYGIAPNYRVVTRDVKRCGVAFRKGDMVLGFLPVAGLDPKVAPEPLRFDVDRPQHPHLTFSTGPHGCLGRHLAMMELRVVFEEWLKLIPSWRADRTPCRGHGGAVIGIESLPLSWSVRGAAVASSEPSAGGAGMPW